MLHSITKPWFQCLVVLLAVCLCVKAFPASIPEGKIATARPSEISVSPYPDLTTGTASNDAIESTQAILERARKEYILELENGFATFGQGDEFESLKVWSDNDFTSHSVGSGNSGPDEAALTRGHQVFQSVAPVLTDEECDALIAEAQKVIAEGLAAESSSSSSPTDNTEGNQPSNSQLGEARVSQLPMAREWLGHVLHKRFFPLLASRFGIPAADLTLHDGLVIGYGYFGAGARSQPVHRDSCLLSLNVALSPRTDYEGGGTYFEGLASAAGTLSSERGHVTCHAGGTPHAGRGIESGERWVLVLFCVAKNQPELARRCHARGMEERDQGILEQAKATFQAGLSVAPRDHLLHTSLGGVYMAEGNEAAARTCLAFAAQGYDHCTKANMALGRMMLANRKPRAALRRFDAVLDWLGDRDLVEGVWDSHRAVGFDARLYGAQAALICAREAKHKGTRDFPWREHAERAVTRSEIALQAVPGDQRLMGMLGFAEGLLKD